MRRLSLSFLIVACASALSGCWNGRLLIAMDGAAWAAEDGDALLRRPLIKTSLLHGYMPRILVTQPQEDPQASIMRAIQSRRYHTIIMGQLLPLPPGVGAPVGSRMLLVGDEDDQAQDQTARLLFDRTAAFRTAGLAAGYSVSQEAGGTVTNALASRIGVLVSARPPGTSGELAAFTQGVAQALDGGQPSMRSLSAPVDRTAVKAAVDQMRRDGVEVFLLFMGAPDAWALEDLKDSGGSAVVSDWAASAAFPQQVFLSIESDLVGGVALFLAGKEDAEGTVSGPVRVVAGKARTVPPQLSSLVAPR